MSTPLTHPTIIRTPKHLCAGKEKARALLEKHWDTWVTKDDLTTLKNAGITHLRIPIGYWCVREYMCG
jgi:aryl-phospho-beta-D-glucosidase BglC (GH1 family)